MKKAEKILLILAITGVVLKLLLISGSGLLITVALMSLSIMYSVFSFAFFNQIRLRQIFNRDSYKGISAWRIIGTIVLGFSLSCAITGILFKLQSWNGGALLTFVGYVCLILCLIVALISYYKNSKTRSDQFIFNRLIIIGILSLIFYFIPRSLFVETFKRNYPDYVQAVKNLEKDPHNQYFIEEERLQRHLMQSGHRRKKLK